MLGVDDNMTQDVNLIPENTKRKVDSLGRIVIPKSMRDRFGINTNDELEFLSLDLDGMHYVCVTNGKTVDPKYRAAALVLEELGEGIPQALAEKLS